MAGRVQTLLDKLPRSLRSDKSNVAVRYVDGQMVSVVKQSKAPSFATDAHVSKSKRRTQVGTDGKKGKEKESTTSILNRALNAEALSAIVSLHALWIVRLGSMVLEDYIGRETLSARDSHRPSSKQSTLSAIFAMTVSVALALIAASSSWVDQLERWKVATRLAPSRSTMLPVQAIIYLEFCATLVSLAGPLCRLNESSALGSILPRKVSLPSPSHSPSLMDMVPMPGAVSELFRARAFASPAALPPFRTRQRMAAHWVSPNLADRALIMGPGGVPGGRDATRIGNRVPVRPASTSSGITLADPLRLPTSGKAPRMTGMRVRVETTWLAENLITFFGHLIGALQYAIVAVRIDSPSMTAHSLTYTLLPVFAPHSGTDLLPILALTSVATI